jgi:hypothetical protein
MARVNMQKILRTMRHVWVRRNRKILIRRLSGFYLILMGIIAVAAQPARAQSNPFTSISDSMPVEILAPWFDRERTEVEDEVVLRGSLHFTVRVWKTGVHVDRFQFHGNVVDVHGTSEATGQRFRLNGAVSFDLLDPAVTYNPDGTFNLPPQDVKFFLHKVDPEPARLDSYLGATISYAGASYYGIGLSTPPTVYDVRVLAGGPACPIGRCDVPNGAILFNGYTGDYYLPLQMMAKRFPGGIIQWHCTTGNVEAPVITYNGGQYGFCTPFYSATEPITVYATTSEGLSAGSLNTSRTYRMLERPIGGTPEIQSYNDKTAFLATTGAVNATGPMPNLGAIDIATIGSVTFSMASGAAGLYIGGGDSVLDWYPQTPQNEVALGYERLQVTTEAPVYSLGFEFIEPNATMPLWGGTPVDSTYQVTLFSGITQVGQFTFNAPDDVATAFIGVWSDTAFDRAVIIDITPSPNSDDDEYFGEFFTGTTPLP